MNIPKERSLCSGLLFFMTTFIHLKGYCLWETFCDNVVEIEQGTIELQFVNCSHDMGLIYPDSIKLNQSDECQPNEIFRDSKIQQLISIKIASLQLSQLPRGALYQFIFYYTVLQ